MFFPFADDPNPPRYTPITTWVLILINIAVFLFVSLPLSLKPLPVDLSSPVIRDYLETVLPREVISPDNLDLVLSRLDAYDIFVFQHGFKPARPSLVDLFCSLFLHANLLHLAGNMLFLWIFGDNAEHYFGRKRYLLIYLVSGLIATLSFAAFAAHSAVPLIGASGAISGVLGLYFVLFPRNRIKVFVALFPFFIDVVKLPARLVLGAYLIIDNLLPFVFSSRHGGVAYGAHLGGFATGWIIARFGEQWSLLSIRSKKLEPDHRRSLALALADAVRENDRERSIALLKSADYESPTEFAGELTSSDARRLASILVDAGFGLSAIRLLRAKLAAPGSATQAERAGILLDLGLLRLRQGQVAAAYQHFLAALDSSPDPETTAHVHRALDALKKIRWTR